MLSGVWPYSVSQPRLPSRLHIFLFIHLANRPPSKVLLFVLWYCHKRGREVRLDREGRENSTGRVEELPDDLPLPAPERGSSNAETPTIVEPSENNSDHQLPPPPIGKSSSR